MKNVKLQRKRQKQSFRQEKPEKYEYLNTKQI